MGSPSRGVRIVVVASVFALALVLSGCWEMKSPVIGGSSAIVTSDTAASIDTQTTEAATTPPVAPRSGPQIYTPLNGSKVRKEMLDAARKKLGTTSSFYVNQLWAQGEAAAVGDLTETTGQDRRLFFVWVGPPWRTVWYTPVGDGAATMQRALQAVPELTSDLARTIDWTVVKAPGKSAIEASLSSAAKQWTSQLMSGKGKPYQISLLRVAQGSSGVWWGRVVVDPTGDATNQYESIEYWAKYSGGSWTGKAQDPEPPSPTTYFPAAVTVPLFK